MAMNKKGTVYSSFGNIIGIVAISVIVLQIAAVVLKGFKFLIPVKVKMK
jgi:hypothetical protein